MLVKQLKNITSRFHTFLEGSLLTLIGMFLLGVLNYLIRRKLSFDLSMEDFAAFYAIFSLFYFIAAIGHLGTVDAMLFLLPRYWIERKFKRARSIFSTICSFNLYSAVFCIVILLLLSPCIGLFQASKKLIYYALPLLFVTFFEGLPNNGLTAMKSFRTFNILLVTKTALIFLFVCLWSKTAGIIGTLLAFEIPTFCCIAAGFGFLFFKFKLQPCGKISRHIAKRNAPVCLWLFSLSLGNLAINELGTVILSFCSSSKEVAYFNIAIPTSMIVKTVYSVFPVFVPMILELFSSKEYRQILITARITAVTAIVLCLLEIPVFLCGGEQIITFLFGAKYTEAKWCTFLLVEATTIGIVSQYISYVLNSIGKTKICSQVTLFMLFFSLILFLVCGKPSGAIGVAAGAILIYTVWGVINYRILLNNYQKSCKC